MHRNLQRLIQYGASPLLFPLIIKDECVGSSGYGYLQCLKRLGKDIACQSGADPGIQSRVGTFLILKFNRHNTKNAKNIYTLFI